jgi:hypothetical protein
MKTLFRSAGVAAACALGLSGCGQTDPSLGISPGTFQAVMDPIGRLTIAPSSETALTYASTDAFDRSLHASMKGQTPVITVSVPASAGLTVTEINTAATGLSPGDERMTRWTRRVKESGGSLIACQNARPESAGLWSAIGLLLGWLSPILSDYLTYRPAGSYHAIIFHDRTGDQVQGVKFVRRELIADPAALTCQAASAL